MIGKARTGEEELSETWTLFLENQPDIENMQQQTLDLIRKLAHVQRKIARLNSKHALKALDEKPSTEADELLGTTGNVATYLSDIARRLSHCQSLLTLIIAHMDEIRTSKV